MVELAALCVSTLLYAAGLWGSVKVLDRYNMRNTFYTALGVGFVFALIMPWLGLLFGVLPLMGLLFLLVFHYQMGYAHSFLVILLQGVILYVAVEILVGVVGEFGEQTAVAWLLVVGFLAFMGFYVRRDLARRKSGIHDRRDAAPIPPAQARQAHKPAAEPPPPLPPPLPPPEPSAPVPAPAEPPRETAERPLPEAGDDPDEPRFLR